MAMSKKRSKSESKLADGTSIREYEEEETRNDGTRVVTTTTIKTYSTKKTLQDGSQVVENTTTTTTTAKEIQTIRRAPPEAVQGVVKGVDAVVEFFTNGANCDGPNCDAWSEPTFQDREPPDHPHLREPDISRFSWEECTTAGDRTADPSVNSETPPRRRENGGARKGERRRREREVARGKERRKDRRQDRIGPDDNRENEKLREEIKSLAKAVNIEQGARGADSESERDEDPNSRMPCGDEWGRRPSARQGVRARTAPPPPPAGSGSAPTAFFRKTNPGNGDRDNDGHDDDIDDRPSMCANSFAVYESDRCERLPVFHKVGESRGESGRKFAVGKRPLVRNPSDSSQGANNNIRLGLHSGRHGKSSRRKSEKDLDPQVVDAISILRQRSKSPMRDVRQRSSSQSQKRPTTARQPTHPMIPNQPPGRSMSSPRAGYRANQNQGQSSPLPADARAGRGAVNFDGLPLGRLANPIEWDDVSEMRDDFDTIRAAARTGAAPAQSSEKPGPSKSKKKATERPPNMQPPTLVKHDQALLPKDVQCAASSPKIAIHKNSAVISCDKYIHFYCFRDSKWLRTTTVALLNTHNISLAVWKDTAVIGVPYDRNAKGVTTGGAYIFERDGTSGTWYQVKKIVPKKTKEYATVGYSVDVCNNVVAVGVPELGADGSGGGGGSGAAGGGGGGGSVYVYQRAERFKWAPMGKLAMGDGGANNNATALTAVGQVGTDGRAGLTLGGFGSVVALRGRILVASDVRPNDRSSDASLLAYEYDPALKNKWRLVQSDLLSTEGRRRRFGSRVALTNDGEGILVGCRPGADPAEILYFRRRGQADPYGNRSFELRQIITLPERCDVVSDLKVDGSDTLMLGTLNQDRVYVYRRTPDDPNATEDRGQWTLACRVAHKGPERADEFGTNVGLSGDRVLVGSRGDVYAHGLEAWRKASEGRRGFMGRRSSARSRPGPSQGRRRFARSMPPLRLRR